MPVINIEFDDAILSNEEARELSVAAQKAVSSATGIEDVFVYANSARIKVGIAPIEIFVRASVSVVPDIEKLLAEIKNKLAGWKREANFSHPINLTLIPMQWKFEVSI